MHILKDMNLQYVTDESGEKRTVIFPFEEFMELMDDLDDVLAIAERRDEPAVSHDDVVDDLKKDELL